MRCLVALVIAVSSARAHAQDALVATLPNNNTVSFYTYDLSSGSAAFYFSMPVPAGFRVISLATLPDCRIAAGLSTETSSTAQRLALIEPTNATVQVVTFGPPLSTSYSEGLEYSPRHGGLIVGFGALNQFGTTRLALVNLDGSVAATSGANLFSDIDYIASSNTRDLLLDLNRLSTPRIVNMTTLFPNPAVTAFASPPSIGNGANDAAIHPASERLYFVTFDGARVNEIVGNTYVAGPASQVAGLKAITFATLPPRNTTSFRSGVCPGESAVLSARAVGSQPFAYRWQVQDPQTLAWSDLSDGPLALGCGMAQVHGADERDLVIDVPECTTLPTLRFRAVLGNDCGTAVSPEVTFAPCPGDFNCDGVVDDTDFVFFAAGYEIFSIPPAGPEFDLFPDGFIDDNDFVIFAAAYAEFGCP